MYIYKRSVPMSASAANVKLKEGIDVGSNTNQVGAQEAGLKVDLEASLEELEVVQVVAEGLPLGDPVNVEVLAALPFAQQEVGVADWASDETGSPQEVLCPRCQSCLIHLYTLLQPPPLPRPLLEWTDLKATFKNS